MIDWMGVGTAALWISGLAVLLATLSRAHWLAGHLRLPLRTTLGLRRVQIASHVGLLLFSAGLLLSAVALWERLAWAGLALAYAASALFAWRQAQPHHNPSGSAVPASSQSMASAPAVPDALAPPSRSDAQSARRRLATWVDRAELGFILAALPFLLFPGRYTPWALAGLAAWWALRGCTTGRLHAPTPVDAPILILLLLLPVALWASADAALARPALYQLLAGMALFYGIVNWASTPQRLASATTLLVLSGVGLAALAPLAATNWGSAELFNALPLLARLHPPSRPLFREDINANVLAGGLALLWPVAAALCVAPLQRLNWKTILVRLALAASLLWMGAILLLTQSRGALLALGAALAFMAALRWRWVRRLALLGLAALLVVVWRGGVLQLQRWADLLSTSGSVTSLSGRQEVWSRALYMIQDFPYTGIGLGTFDLVQPLLYPFFLSAGPAHHAHNLFLQVAVDLGLPGLIAYLALLMGSSYTAWRAYSSPHPLPRERVRERGDWLDHTLALGLLGSLVVLVVHGLLDAVAWGTKVAFLPWFVMGLAVALQNSECTPEEHQSS